MSASARKITQGGDSNAVRCLVVDDDSFDRRLLRAAARGCATQLELTEAGTLDEGRARYAELRPEILILDSRLPDGEGVDFARELARDARMNGTSVIMLTNVEGEEAVVEAMRAGATDYLVKRRLTADALQRAIDRSIAGAMDVGAEELGVDPQRLGLTLDQLAQLKRDVLRILSRSWTMVEGEKAPDPTDRQELSSITRSAVANIDDITIGSRDLLRRHAPAARRYPRHFAGMPRRHARSDRGSRRRSPSAPLAETDLRAVASASDPRSAGAAWPAIRAHGPRPANRVWWW